MAKFSKTAKILGGVGILGIVGAAGAAIIGGKKTEEPQMIEGECTEVVEEETYSDAE